MAKQNLTTADKKKNKKVYDKSTRQHGYRNFVKTFIRKHKNKRMNMRDIICMAAQQWRVMPLRDRIKYFLTKQESREKDCSSIDCTPRSDKDHHHVPHPPSPPRVPPLVLPYDEDEDVEERPVNWQRVTNVFLFGVMMLFVLMTKR